MKQNDTTALNQSSYPGLWLITFIFVVNWPGYGECILGGYEQFVCTVTRNIMALLQSIKKCLPPGSHFGGKLRYDYSRIHINRGD